jgi:hypothetical protein
MDLVSKIDRTVLSSTAPLVLALDGLSNFRTVSDYVLRQKSANQFGAYGRVRTLVNDKTKTQIFLQYQPRMRKQAPIRVAIVPIDTVGLRRKELELILRAFAPWRFSVIEFAMDFSSADMDAAFVRQHLKCGKSRMRPNRNFPNAVWFGAPGSEQFTRCYFKHGK